MKGSIRIVATMAVLGIVGFGSSVAAASNDGLAVVPKVGFSYKTVTLEAAGGRKSFSPLFITLDLGLTLAYKSVYFSVGYDSSIRNDLTHNTTPSGSGGVDDSIVYSTRSDGAATLGYAIGWGFSLFTGWKYGESVGYGFADGTGSVKNFQSRVTANGPFFGTSYSYRFGDKGSVDLSVAYASMSGLNKYTTASSGTETEGRTTGFSYGIAWSGSLSETAGYSVGFKANRYEFDADPPPGSNENPDLDEIHNIFYVLVQKFF